MLIVVVECRPLSRPLGWGLTRAAGSREDSKQATRIWTAHTGGSSSSCAPSPRAGGS